MSSLEGGDIQVGWRAERVGAALPSLRTRRGHVRELGRRARVCLLEATGEVFRFGPEASG